MYSGCKMVVSVMSYNVHVIIDASLECTCKSYLMAVVLAVFALCEYQ